MLFTLLGLYALFQRERKGVDNNPSGRDEDVAQSDDVPPVEKNDGQTSSQDSGPPQLFHISEERITADPRVHDDWTDLVQTPDHGAPDMSVDVAQDSHGETSSQDSSGPPRLFYISEESITARTQVDDDDQTDPITQDSHGQTSSQVSSRPPQLLHILEKGIFANPRVGWTYLFRTPDHGAENKRKMMEIRSCWYEMGIPLGDGGFGTVYAATRLKDGHQVAVKFACKRDVKYARVEGYSRPIPLEVALQLFANREPNVPHIIRLLDWQDEADRYIMVLERPMPCQTLYDFFPYYKGPKYEDLLRIIMQQTTFAAQACCRREVFHRDIKLENLLINPNTLEVKLIDFGCGEFLNSAGYKSFAGTKEYIPPEFRTNGHYHGKPATVWSLGIVLFLMLCRSFPRRRDLERMKHYIWTKNGLSQECCDFVCCCLQIDPKERIKLEKVGLHNWFKTK